MNSAAAQSVRPKQAPASPECSPLVAAIRRAALANPIICGPPGAAACRTARQRHRIEGMSVPRSELSNPQSCV
jgi:hypothetical protein